MAENNASGHPPLQLALIVGSVRKGRFADVILTWLTAELRTADWLRLDVIDPAELPDDALSPSGIQPGGGASPISDRLANADGFIVLTPEYNHSFPGGLKNVIDHHYRQWARKPVTFVSYGATSGGIRAVEHLRPVFSELDAMTTRSAVTLVSPWEHLDETGSRYLPQPRTSEALTSALGELRWWSLALREARAGSALAA